MYSVQTAAIFLLTALLAANETVPNDDPQRKTSEVERGYSSKDIQKGWAFGYDTIEQPTEDEQIPAVGKVRKGKHGVQDILEEMLAVQKEHLREQKKIRQILEEQYDPKPKVMTKPDGTKCIANSSADCFDFPLIPEARRVPVLANYLKNPHDIKAVSEYKRWMATYLTHAFDIGRAAEYEAAQNGSATFNLDFKRDGYDSAQGFYYVAKDRHNTRLINALGSKGLSLTIYLGVTQELDVFSMDQIAIFTSEHPSLPITLLFADQKSAAVFGGGAKHLDFVGRAFSQKNVTKRIAKKDELPSSIQATPAYEISYTDSARKKKQIIRSGKIDSGGLASRIIDWMMYEKIITPGQLNDSRIWKDEDTGYGTRYIEKLYNINIRGGR